MYHSHLLINVGDDPDQPDWDITRRWLRNLYRVHQRLCMAFPSAEAGGSDVHRGRCTNGGFLFRIDQPVDAHTGRRRPVILVQSATEPDWEYAFGLTEGLTDDCGRPIGNAAFLLAAPPQCRRVAYDSEGDALYLRCPTTPSQDCRLPRGQLVQFRLRANPTVKREGKRRRVRPVLSAHAEWLTRKLGDAAEVTCIETFAPGWAHGWRGKHESMDDRHMQWWSVLLEGSFRVGDPAALRGLLESGIGSAKAFGFGLLSVAPAT